MKYVVMNEGTCEKALIDVLIEKNIFSIEIESLLYEQVFHARQIKSSLVERINQLPIDEKISIIRIGDTLTDELYIPDEIKDRLECCKKICIKPEFEILHLIQRKEDSNYIKKQKSKLKASENLYQIDCNYEKSYEYNFVFFASLSNEEIKDIIHTYNLRRSKVHNNDEGTLEELIK